jgi:hypothetical protein
VYWIQATERSIVDIRLLRRTTCNFNTENEARDNISSANRKCDHVMGAFHITEHDRMKVSHNQIFVPTKAIPGIVVVNAKRCKRCDVTFQLIVLKSCIVQTIIKTIAKSHWIQASYQLFINDASPTLLNKLIWLTYRLCNISANHYYYYCAEDAGSWIWFAFTGGSSGIMGDNDRIGNLFQSFVRSTINRRTQHFISGSARRIL